MALAGRDVLRRPRGLLRGQHVGELAVGQAVSLTVESLGSRVFEGTVAFIEPAVDQWGLDTRFQRHVSFNGGTLIRLEGPWSFHPTGSLRFSAGAPVAVDVQAMFDYDEVIRFGLGYRNETALSCRVTLKVMENVMVSYAFDWNVGPLSQASSNTHEVMVGLLACPIKSGHAPCAAFQ